MSKILAALDSSAAARPVLAMAVALGEALDAAVEAVHVGADGDQTPVSVAGSLGVPYVALQGEPAAMISARAAQADVVAVVVGARRRVSGDHLGHLARGLADALDKPILVVPPEARWCEHLHTVVVAMEGTAHKARALKSAIDLAVGLELEIVVVHVDDEDTIPSFSDQVAYEAEAYAREFLARYLPNAPEARLELRIGAPADEVLKVSDELGADLVAVGWPHTIDPDRGTVAQQILDRSHVPVLLVALNDQAA